MAIGRPLNLTANVASKNNSVLSTAGQTSFTVAGGYRINEIAVYRNGTRLADGRDFTATDGLTVTLVSAATLYDVIEYQIFDSFNVANAVGTSGDSTINGNLTITGVTTATKFSGPTNIPGNVTTGPYTIVAADAGKLVSATGTVTLPAATFAVGDAISVYNNTGSDMTLTCSAPTKVYLGTDGSTVTSLTLALRCICTFVCVDTTSNDSFVATGGGLN